MKIVFVLHSLFGGGAERVISVISKCLANEGSEVLLITNTFGISEYEISKEVKIIPFYRSAKQGYSRFKLFYQILTVRTVMINNPEAIVVGVMPTMFLVVAIASLFLKNRIVASDHTSFERPLKWHMNFIRKYVYKKADAVTMLTKTDYSFLKDWFKEKYVMPNPLAYTPIDRIETPREKKILAVGRLDDWEVKGFDLLIEAWAKIAKSHTDWKLEIAGKGSASSVEYLKNIAKQHNVRDNFVLSGFHSDIDKVMRESPIFALTSRHEGFGLVLIEAMSQGCACISFDCGGRQREIIEDGVSGIIVDNHDVNKLAEQLEYLIDNQEKRLQLASNGIKRSNDFNLDIITERWISMFHHLKAQS